MLASFPSCSKKLLGWRTIAIGLEAIATRLEAIASRLEAITTSSKDESIEMRNECDFVVEKHLRQPLVCAAK